MGTKKKSTKRVRVVEEMPKFKRTTRVGVSKAKVEKKKMHTNTKPIVKKVKPKTLNKNFFRRIMYAVWNIVYEGGELSDKRTRLMESIDKYNNKNSKENIKSVTYSAELLIKHCNRVQAEIDRIRENCNNIKEAVSEK